MKIDLTPLLSGEVDEIAIDYPLTIEGSFGGVAFPDPVRVLGTVTDKAGYTALKAKLHFRYDTVCDRCLRPVSVSGAREFSRTVALSGSLQNEDRDEVLERRLEHVHPRPSLAASVTAALHRDGKLVRASERRGEQRHENGDKRLRALD